MIQLEQAFFSFGREPILRDVDLLIPGGSKVGLVGRNGTGKTTFLRLVLGDLRLDAGRLRMPRRIRTAFLPQHPEIGGEQSILRHVLESHPTLGDLEDEILHLERRMAEESDPDRLDRLVERHRGVSRQFESQGGYELEARVVSILTGLGFQRDDLLREVGPLSPGEKNRVALAKVLLTEGQLLLLDEPTNHLDFDMLEWLEAFLRDPPQGSGDGRTALVVSHDRYFLNAFATHVLEMRDGGLFLYSGNYDDFARQRAEELARREKEYRLQQKEIDREEEFIRRNFAAQKARQAKSREKRLARLEIVEAVQRDEPGPRIRFDMVKRAGDDVLRVEGLECGYGAEVLLRNVNLELQKGDRCALIGPNGCGKTTLLRCIVGELKPLRGRIHVGLRTELGYYEQDVRSEGGDRSVFEEVHDLVPRWTDQAVRDTLASFLFRGDEVSAVTSLLSGGETARLALLRLILSGANLLVLDEPTNHLDIHARAALEESLLEFPGTVLFVSHDRYFVERVATRVLAVRTGAVEHMLGGYEEYRTYCVRRRQDERQAAPARRRRKSRRAASRTGAGARQAEEARLIKSIARLEEEIRLRHEASGREEHYRNPDSMRALKREIAHLEAELEEAYRNWEAFEQ